MARISKVQRAHWRNLIRELKKRLPPPYPVTIRTCRMSKYDADTLAYEYNDGSREVVVRIGSHLSFRERLHHIQHEYAHALDKKYIDMLLAIEKECHTKEWGILLADAYYVIQDIVLFEHW